MRARPRSAAAHRFEEFLRAQLPSAWVAAVDRGDDDALGSVATGETGAAVAATVARAGFLTPDWPEEFGGCGLAADEAADIRAMLRAWRIGDVRLAAGVGWIGPTILRLGTPEHRARLLPPIARAEELWCQLFSEPDAGSDLASLTTRASLRPDGQWVVDGSKIWVSRADIAHRALLLARTEPEPRHAGITAFCLDMTTPGITVSPIRQMTGDCEFFSVTLSGVLVPDRDRLGARGEGWSVARTVLSFERSAGSGLGAAPPGSVVGRDLDELLAARPAADPVRRDVLVRLWIIDRVVALNNRRAAATKALGSSGPPPEATKILQAMHSQALQEAFVDAGGPHGCAWEPDDAWAESNAWAFLRTRAKTIAGGTSEVLKNMIAERVLGLPR